MWLLTRTRPDLMFCLSKMSQAILRNPKEVVGVSKQVWKYLRKTQDEGLWIRRGLYGLVLWSWGSRFSGHSAGLLEWKLTAVEVWKTVHPISLYGGERTFRSGRRNGDGRQRGRSRPRDLRRRIPKDHQGRQHCRDQPSYRSFWKLENEALASQSITCPMVIWKNGLDG